jgi:hypothetical protein
MLFGLHDSLMLKYILFASFLIAIITLLLPCLKSSTTRKQKRFKFENWWLSKHDYKEILCQFVQAGGGWQEMVNLIRKTSVKWARLRARTKPNPDDKLLQIKNEMHKLQMNGLTGSQRQVQLSDKHNRVLLKRKAY